MQIKYISVYSHDGKRNDVKLETGKLNILTGGSGRGKSQLVDIISYCLGSRECTVAKGIITKSVSWYSMVLEFNDCSVFIARKAPLLGFSSSTTCDLKMNVNKPLAYEDLDESTNITGLLKYLTKKIGISEYTTDVPKENSRPNITISIKHAKAFIFQRQTEIASDNVLFHRQHDGPVKQAIKDVLPYFMGASNESRLNDIEKLRELKRKRAKLLKEIKEQDQIKGQGLSKGRMLLIEAIATGLAEDDIYVSDKELVKILKKLADVLPDSPKTEVFPLDPLIKLELDRDQIRDEKVEINTQLQNILEYERNINSIDYEYGEQRARLESINLFSRLNSGDVKFYDCLEHIKNIIEKNASILKSELSGIEKAKPSLSGAIKELKEKDDLLSIKLKETRSAISSIKSKRNKDNKLRNLEQRQSKVIGRISLYLESVTWGSDTSPLTKKIEKLEPFITELELKLDPSRINRILESQLSCLSEDMTKWARELRLEHSKYPIRLDPKVLTVAADTPNGRTELYRMGSGANWVGYHLVTLVALAKWFIEHGRPVPNFIFFDQPTQVYFPSDPTGDGSLSSIKKDEDRIKVERMFKWLAKIAKELSPKLQIIVTDHADIHEDWFQDCTVTPKWRGEEHALIPYSWIPEGYDSEE
ncbi:DUF3732 domain-containing protein [Vibrio splendidus]|uniref:DUF3732 domain-containing protein n=1 Tax=Vibrio splendidus TaxID=29497 RepID=UPI000D3A99F9|nr:DUF3732 domain-containing protein [Vibrio splendidus]PTO77595.1 DUF3732 domain-containing protein [Vibrio splendidus]